MVCFGVQHDRARSHLINGADSDLTTKAGLPKVTYQWPDSFPDARMCVCISPTPAKDKLYPHFFSNLPLEKY